jgi:hypothetical protein
VSKAAVAAWGDRRGERHARARSSCASGQASGRSIRTSVAAECGQAAWTNSRSIERRASLLPLPRTCRSQPLHAPTDHSNQLRCSAPRRLPSACSYPPAPRRAPTEAHSPPSTQAPPACGSPRMRARPMRMRALPMRSPRTVAPPAHDALAGTPKRQSATVAHRVRARPRASSRPRALSNESVHTPQSPPASPHTKLSLRAGPATAQPKSRLALRVGAAAPRRRRRTEAIGRARRAACSANPKAW